MRSLWFISAVGRGHIARCRPLIRALQAGGHVSTAAVMGRHAASLLGDLCPVIRAPSPPSARKTMGALRTPRRDALAFVAIRDLEMTMAAHQTSRDAAVRAARFVADAIAEADPDVVFVDQVVIAGPIAAARKIPVVQVSHSTMLRPEDCWVPELASDPRVHCPAQLPWVNDALAEVGAEPVEGLGELMAGDVVLVPTPREFGSEPRAKHMIFHPDLPHEASPSPSHNGRPRVAVSMGGAPQLAQAPVAAATSLGLEVVVLEWERAELPPRLLDHDGIVALPTIDPKQWLPQCDLVIHHGGAGSATAGLLAGIPAVVVPTWTEQKLNGCVLQARGAGVLVAPSEEELEPIELAPGLVTLGHRHASELERRLRGAIELGLTAAYREAARRWRAELDRPELDDLTSEIEQLLGAGKSVVGY